MGAPLKEKIAIVTGAGSVGEGIGNGKATAIVFAREGAKVMLVDCKESAAQETLQIIGIGQTGAPEIDCATLLHKARELPKEQFRREVEKELAGTETEPWEIIYFKLYKTQVPVIEQALETAGLMLGSDTSRGYCWK